MSAEASAILAALIIVGAASGLYAWRRYHDAERTLRRTLNPICADMLSHIYLPDDLGGEIYINHLLLTGHGLLLLDVKDAYGTIYSGTQLNEWSARQPQNAVTFSNPLPALRDARRAVHQIAPDVPVHIRVLFRDGAVFAKGQPAEVTTVTSLRQEFPPIDNGNATRPYEAAWRAVELKAVTD